MSDIDEVKALLLELADCARRTERKLDILVDALMEEEQPEEVPSFDLDGNESGRMRDPTGEL